MALEDRDTSDMAPDPQVLAAFEARLVDGKLPCSVAFEVAEALEVEPLTVGETATAAEIRLTRCQLGFFGYPGKQAWQSVDVTTWTMPDGLEAALTEAAGEDQALACARAWELASSFSVPRMQVGYLADKLGIHVTPCQLGAF
jgi:hypothetical protein